MNYLTSYRPVLDVFNQFHRSPAAGFNVDIAESADEYRITAGLAGFEAADTDVRVEDNLLVIETRKTEDTEQSNDLTWHIRERRNGQLKRSFVLPDDVDKSDISAEMKNGILTVSLRKTAESKPFSIEIKS